ncbi:MAG TPA: FHA domain-containing protein [Dictyobacter sp.]|jgi:hypothetical protein|nr:FHA domain-containing protein [Dictyobacter sp.]
MTQAFLIVLGSIVSTPVIVIAIIALAVIVLIGALFILRSGKKKDNLSPSMSGTSDWQRQGQPGMNPWNNQQQGQGSSSNWNQQQQPAAGAWNAPNTGGQQSNPWAAQQQQSNPWAAQQQPADNAWAAQQQPADNAWAAQQQQQQQPNNPWAAQQAQQSNPWATQQQQQQQPSGNSWGNSQGGNPWEAAPAAAPAAQDPWNQNPQQGGTGQPWGANASQSQPGWPQQAQQQSNPWATQQAQPQQPPAAYQTPAAQTSMPSWQQPQTAGNFNQGDPTSFAGGMDNDRTVVRAPGAGAMPGAAVIGMVRVEEGKEVGRIYEIRKDSFSIGRSRESDIFLEDLAVSRLHASIVNMGNGSYALKDEGSANGTKVNGQLLNKFQTYPLQEGDRVQLGQTVLVFSRKQ